jgi:penicillin-binding protein 1A
MNDRKTPFQADDDAPAPGVRRTYLRSAVGITAIVVSFIGLALVLWLVDIASGLPSLEDLENPHPDLSTKIISADGIQLDQFYVHNRTYIPYDSIPHAFFDALIATEDQAFYDHWGVHIERILKAMVKNVLSMNLTKEGASTITQQLARNLYLTQEVTMSRKIREQLTAVQIERAYTKNEILELYANTVYFGRGAYGIQVAAEIFYGKRPQDLTVDECAYLVGMLKAPENYDAGMHPDRAIQRRNTVLGLMQDVGFISGTEFGKAIAKPIALVKRKRRFGVAGHFVEAVRLTLARNPALQRYNLYRDGLVIHTTIDSRIQKYANEAVREHLNEFQPMFDKVWSWRGKEKLLQSIVDRAARESDNYREAVGTAQKERVLQTLVTDPAFIDSVKRSSTEIECGFVAIEPRTGYVRAMVGGVDATAGRGLNHVMQIRRQPGSAFKPIVYASALQSGMKPNSGISAAPVVYRLPSGEVWAPKGGGGGGWMTLRNALKFSVNSVAARLITEKTSPAKVVRLAKEMGIKSPIPEYPSIALGSAEVTPLELVSAYCVFPNDGLYVEPTLVTKIEDRWGHVIFKAAPEMHEAMSPVIAQEMVDMMRGVVDGGTASSVRRWFNYPAAGKTGTTQNFADAWFIGYTPELTAGAWIGFDDHRIRFTGWYGQGGKAAAPIWGRFMAKVYADDRLPYDKGDFTTQEPRKYDGLRTGRHYVPMENAAPPADAISNDGTGDNAARYGDEPSSPPTSTDGNGAPPSEQPPPFRPAPELPPSSNDPSKFSNGEKTK